MSGVLLPLVAHLTDLPNWSACASLASIAMRFLVLSKLPPPPSAPPSLSQKPTRKKLSRRYTDRELSRKRSGQKIMEDEVDDSERFKKIFQMSSFTPLMKNEGLKPLDESSKKSPEKHTGFAKGSGRGRIKKFMKDPLVWIDLEMTGLDLEKDTIIEIACIVTDGSLNRRVEGPEIAIKHPDIVFDSMCEWCVKQHGKSGLTQRCRQSTITLSEAENKILHFLQQHLEPNSAQLAGNSVHIDKSFLQRYMPKINNFLHFKILDVSTLQEIVRRWFPKQWKNAPRKKNEHTAMSDIRESIKELEYYLSGMFKE